MPADEGRGGRRVLPANGRIRYGSWPGSQHGKGQPAPLQGGHVNLSTPAGELIRLQNPVSRASGQADQRWPKAASGGRQRPESQEASGEGSEAEGQAPCPELAAGWAARSSWLSIPRANRPGWDCLGGNKGDGEVLA